MSRRPRRAALVAMLVLATSCAAQEPGDSDAVPRPDRSSSAAEPEPPAATRTPTRQRQRSPRRPAAGTIVTVRPSEFGAMLFDRRGQAIYLFEPESDGTPACYGPCAEAWPPVLTKGSPRARAGAEAGLLGTVRRDDGTIQVTYNGWPLYFYAHERPGEVLCHNVVLNGGLWLVLGPDGEPRPA